MDDDQEAKRRRRMVFIASGAMDMLIGGAMVLLWLLRSDLAGFRMPALGALIGAAMLVVGMAVLIYNLTRLGE